MMQHPVSWLFCFGVGLLFCAYDVLGQQAAVSPSSTGSVAPVQDEVAKLRQQLNGEQDRRKSSEEKLKALKSKVDDVNAQAKEEITKAKQEAEAKLKNALNSFKYINVEFGVLPNSDNQINNYSRLGFNYTPMLQSSLTYYSRTTASTKRESTAVPDPSGLFTLNTATDRSATTDRTDLNFDLLRYAPAKWKVGPAEMNFSFAVGTLYSDSKTVTSYSIKNSYIDPATKREKNVPANGTETEKIKSLLPQIIADYNYKAPWAFVRLSGGVVLLSRDKKSFENAGSLLMPSEAPDPKTNAPYKESVYSEFKFDTGTGYTASGFHVGGDIDLHSQTLGGYGLHFDYLEKFGNTKAFTMEPKIDAKGNQTQELSTSEIYEERSTAQIAVSHSMDYVAKLGVTPIIRINGNLDRVIKTPKEGKRSDEKVKSFDFGIVFKY